MGLFDLFGRSEERLHRELSEILSEYHKLIPLIQAQKGLSEQLTNIHKRVDAINSAIRASSTHTGPERIQYLHQLVKSERELLHAQKAVARTLVDNSKRIIYLEKKTEKAARELERAA